MPSIGLIIKGLQALVLVSVTAQQPYDDMAVYARLRVPYAIIQCATCTQ